jgi:hypothetical protein
MSKANEKKTTVRHMVMLETMKTNLSISTLIGELSAFYSATSSAIWPIIVFSAIRITMPLH